MQVSQQSVKIKQSSLTKLQVESLQTFLQVPAGLLPILSVPVTSRNRYWANLKISRLHLFLQLIFAPGRREEEVEEERRLARFKKKLTEEMTKSPTQGCERSEGDLNFGKVPPQVECPPVSAWPSQCEVESTEGGISCVCVVLCVCVHVSVSGLLGYAAVRPTQWWYVLLLSGH